MMKKISTILIITILLASCSTIPLQRSITVTVGSYYYMGNNQLDVSIEKSNADLKDAERETNKALDALSVYLDEKGLSFSLNSSSTYQDRNSEAEENLFVSMKSLSVLVNDETDSEVLINELQALGATGVYMNSAPVKEGESIQVLMDQATDKAGEIAETLGCKLGKVLSVKHYQDSEVYEVSYEITD